MREYVSLPLFFLTGVVSFILGLFLLEFLRGILRQHILAGELVVPLLLWPILLALVLYFVSRSLRTAVYGLVLAYATSGAVLSPFYSDLREIVPHVGPPLSLLLPLLVFIILIALSVRFGFVWRATGVSCAAVILSFFIMFFITATPHYDTLQISRIEAPTNSIDLTDKLDEYPELQKEVENRATSKPKLGVMEMSPEDYFELESVVSGYDFVKINDSYYKIGLGKSMGVRRLNTAQNYTTVSEGEMNSYPTIKGFIASLEERLKETEVENYERIIHGNGSVSREELLRGAEFVNKYGRQIKYNGNYYEVLVNIRANLDEYEYPPNCTEFSEEYLNQYPYLKKGVEKANREDKAFIETDKLNYRRDTGLDAGCIKYKGSYYGIGVMTP
ncbi:MAG: hypothetical protein R6U44_10595 [Archaeoglobaceae archaeon]